MDSDNEGSVQSILSEEEPEVQQQAEANVAGENVEEGAADNEAQEDNTKVEPKVSFPDSLEVVVELTTTLSFALTLLSF